MFFPIARGKTEVRYGNIFLLADFFISMLGNDPKNLIAMLPAGENVLIDLESQGPLAIAGLFFKHVNLKVFRFGKFNSLEIINGDIL